MAIDPRLLQADTASKSQDEYVPEIYLHDEEYEVDEGKSEEQNKQKDPEHIEASPSDIEVDASERDSSPNSILNPQNILQSPKIIQSSSRTSSIISQQDDDEIAYIASTIPLKFYSIISSLVPHTSYYPLTAYPPQEDNAIPFSVLSRHGRSRYSSSSLDTASQDTQSQDAQSADEGQPNDDPPSVETLMRLVMYDELRKNRFQNRMYGPNILLNSKRNSGRNGVSV